MEASESQHAAGENAQGDVDTAIPLATSSAA